MCETPEYIYLVSGEPSGDLLTAPLVAALRKQYPNAKFRGIGGDRMAAEGVELVFHIRDFSVMGLVEVATSFRRITKLLKATLLDIHLTKPHLLICTDFPGFNLALAARARKLVPQICWFVSPKFWAWRYGRVNKLARLTDLVLTIFPFEGDHIRRAGGKAVYEGHPLSDLVRRDLTRDQARKALDWDDNHKRVVLFPGSRKQELKSLLPVALEVRDRLIRETNLHELDYTLHLASPELWDLYASEVISKGLTPLKCDSQVAMRAADFAVVASGTANLETALLGTPQLMYYRMHPTSFWLARRVVKLPYASPVNIVLEKEAIPEIIQVDLPGRITNEIRDFFHNEDACRRQYRKDYAELARLLGEPGVYARLARHVGKLS